MLVYIVQCIGSASMAKIVFFFKFHEMSIRAFNFRIRQMNIKCTSFHEQWQLTNYDNLYNFTHRSSYSNGFYSFSCKSQVSTKRELLGLSVTLNRGEEVQRKTGGAKKNLSDMHFCTITRFYLVVHRGEVTWASANLHSLARAGRHCTVKIVRVNWCMWTQRDHIAHPFVMLMTQWPFYNNKLQQVYELRSMNCSESNPSRTRAYEMSESSLCQNRVIFTSNRAVISRIFGLYPRTLIVGTGGRTRP